MDQIPFAKAYLKTPQLPAANQSPGFKGLARYVALARRFKPRTFSVTRYFPSRHLKRTNTILACYRIFQWKFEIDECFSVPSKNEENNKNFIFILFIRSKFIAKRFRTFCYDYVSEISEKLIAIIEPQTVCNKGAAQKIVKKVRSINENTDGRRNVIFNCCSSQLFRVLLVSDRKRLVHDHEESREGAVKETRVS